MPAEDDRVYLSARVVYADAEAGCTSVGCLDPQAQGAPASCFAGVSGPVQCDANINVVHDPSTDNPFGVMN